jgi:beta-1,4-mannosyltransferase
MLAAPDVEVTGLVSLSWNNEMRVLFLPNYCRTNPYQSLLAKALASCDVSITIPREIEAVPIIPVLRKYGFPEILHFHWLSPYMIEASLSKSLWKTLRFIADLGVVKKKGIRLVWTVHNLYEHTRRHPHWESIANQLVLQNFDQIIVHSKAAAEALSQRHWCATDLKQNITVVPHGNYIEAYENTTCREQARYQLNLRKDELCYLFFGGIKQYKGIYNLIDTFRALAEQAPNVHLVIAGKPAWDMAEKGIEEYCQQDSRILTHLKFIPGSDVQVFMNAADVVVLPYQEIMTSGTVLLAMSFGKPVITPRLGGIPEALGDEWGMYAVSDKEGLLRMMKQALHIDLQTIGHRNLARAKKMDWEMIAQETCRVYQKSLQGSHSTAQRIP